MNALLQTICLTTCALGLICLFIVIFQNKYRLYPKILSIAIISASTITIALWSFYLGQIPLNKHADLALLSEPLYFLPGVLLYLYIKSIIGKNKNFSYWYLLHFVPFAANIITLIPFFSFSREERLNIMLKMLYSQPTDVTFNFISMDVDFFAKLTLWLLYTLLSFKLLLNYNKINKEWIKSHHNLSFWVIVITTIAAVSFIFYVIILLIDYDRYYLSISVIYPPIFLLVTSLLISFFRPTILYGKNYQYEPISGAEPSNIKTLILPQEKILEYKVAITNYVTNNKVYLKKNYTIKQLSEELGISSHHLSYVINSEMDLNFQNYMNKFRVLYIIDNFGKKGLATILFRRNW